MLFNTENPWVEILSIFIAVVLADLATAYLINNASWYPKKKAA